MYPKSCFGFVFFPLVTNPCRWSVVQRMLFICASLTMSSARCSLAVLDVCFSQQMLENCCKCYIVAVWTF